MSKKMYAVVDAYYLQTEKDETYDFKCCEKSHYPEEFKLIEASTKEDAVRKYLDSRYEKCSQDAMIMDCEYEYIMRSFIANSAYGDPVLDHYVNEDAVNALAHEINKYYFLCLIKTGRTEIVQDDTIGADYSIPGDDDDVIEMVQKHFHYSRLIELLTEDEIKECYIEANLYDISVIELTRL